MSTMNPADLDRLLQRICGEYMEMPGLRLSRPQAERLWGLDAATCDVLLDRLVGERFLQRTADGRFVRPSEGGAVSRVPIRMVKADLARSSARRTA